MSGLSEGTPLTWLGCPIKVSSMRTCWQFSRALFAVLCAVCCERVLAFPLGSAWHPPPGPLLTFLLPGAGGPKLLWEILVTPTSERSHPRGKPDFQWRCWCWEVPARGHTAVGEALAGWDHGSLQGKQGTWGGRGSSPELLGHGESRGLLFTSYFTSSVQKLIIYSSYQIETTFFILLLWIVLFIVS